MKFRTSVGFFFIFVFAMAQEPYPQTYFKSPLKQTLVLSGTFAELRSNHFHSGLDLKTNGKEGLKVYTAASGYVSRIKISRYGYGKALYITHPNGYTTVYAHLQKFSAKIESYVKAEQYKKERFEIELFPGINDLPIDKDEIVAFSGNTGGSSGPHLHFEVRDKNQRPINPMLFGIDVKDTTKPEIYNLFAYPLNVESHVNLKSSKVQIRLQKLSDGSYKADPVIACGQIGFGIVSNDRQDYASNKNGVSLISTFFNGEKSLVVDFKRFSFAETKHLNRYIDYAYFKENRKRIQKLFIEKNNPLSLFTYQLNNGQLTVKDSTNSVYVVEVKDFKNNTTSIHIPISGKSFVPKQTDSIRSTHSFLDASSSITLEEQPYKIDITSNTLYDDMFLDFNVNQDTLKLHYPNIPLQKSITIKFDASRFKPEIQQQLFIGSVSKWGKIYPIATKRRGSILIAKTKSFGTFSIGIDNEGPQIEAKNFSNGNWMSNFRYLKIKISDNISGIKNYRASVNDRWILMEYDPKTQTLTHDFNDGIVEDVKNNLKIIVTDNVGNSSKFETTFYRK